MAILSQAFVLLIDSLGWLAIFGSSFVILPSQHTASANYSAELIDAAAVAWQRNLDFTSEFVYRHSEFTHMVDGRIASERSASGAGRISISGSVGALIFDWDAVMDDAPYQALDAFFVDDVLLLRMKVGTIWSPHKIASKAAVSLGSSEVGTKVGGGYRLQNSDGAAVHFRPPLSFIPSAHVFVGGRRDGVVFGGLDLSGNTAMALREKYISIGEKSLVMRWLSQDEFECSLEKATSSGGSIIRLVRFRDFAGLPLKAFESTKQVGSDGELVQYSQMEASSWDILPNGLPFPLKLRCKRTLTKFLPQGEDYFVTEREMSLSKPTLRATSSVDFQIDTADYPLYLKERVARIERPVVEDLRCLRTRAISGSPAESEDGQHQGDRLTQAIPELSGLTSMNRDWHKQFVCFLILFPTVFMLMKVFRLP